MPGLRLTTKLSRLGPDKLSADELLADPNHSGQHMKEEQEWLDAPAVGLEVLTPYDPAEYLTSEDIAIFRPRPKKPAMPAISPAHRKSQSGQ